MKNIAKKKSQDHKILAFLFLLYLMIHMLMESHREMLDIAEGFHDINVIGFRSSPKGAENFRCIMRNPFIINDGSNGIGIEEFWAIYLIVFQFP